MRACVRACPWLSRIPILSADYDLPSKQAVSFPNSLSIPKSLHSAVSSFPWAIHPPSLYPCLSHPLIHQSLSLSNWMMLSVLDPEHEKGLHKYTIHHSQQGQLTTWHAHHWFGVCACHVFSQCHDNTSTPSNSNEKQNVKYEHSTVLMYIHDLNDFPCVIGRSTERLCWPTGSCVCVFPNHICIHTKTQSTALKAFTDPGKLTHKKKTTVAVMCSLCVHMYVLHEQVNW